MYNQNPHGMGLVPPVSAEGKGKYTGSPFVILGGSSSVGQNGELTTKRGMAVVYFNHDIQLFNLPNFLASRP